MRLESPGAVWWDVEGQAGGVNEDHSHLAATERANGKVKPELISNP